jgi:hypothetical protein
VVGALLDAEAPDEFINNLILSVRSLLPVNRLVDEVGLLAAPVRAVASLFPLPDLGGASKEPRCGPGC